MAQLDKDVDSDNDSKFQFIDVIDVNNHPLTVPAVSTSVMEEKSGSYVYPGSSNTTNNIEDNLPFTRISTVSTKAGISKPPSSTIATTSSITLKIGPQTYLFMHLSRPLRSWLTSPISQLHLSSEELLDTLPDFSRRELYSMWCMDPTTDQGRYRIAHYMACLCSFRAGPAAPREQLDHLVGVNAVRPELILMRYKQYNDEHLKRIEPGRRGRLIAEWEENVKQLCQIMHQRNVQRTTNPSDGSETNVLLGIGAGVGVGVGAALLAPVALAAVGFGSAGVAAGSMAAAWQAAIGNVAAGSTFAALQSAGAAGIGAATQSAIVGAGGAIGGLFAKFRGSSSSENGQDTDNDVRYENQG